MPALQVRDFPQELYRELQVCAEQEHRSIAQQTVAIIEQYIWDRKSKQLMPVYGLPRSGGYAERENRALRRRQLFERIDAQTAPKGLTGESLVASIRTEREKRR